ncbi:MAG: hypothetical protein R2882_06110 [Gemmatimonadales bacterium]
MIDTAGMALARISWSMRAVVSRAAMSSYPLGREHFHGPVPSAAGRQTKGRPEGRPDGCLGFAIRLGPAQEALVQRGALIRRRDELAPDEDVLDLGPHVEGIPSVVICRLATLPASMLPIRSATPNILAGLIVSALSASSGSRP